MATRPTRKERTDLKDTLIAVAAVSIGLVVLAVLATAEVISTKDGKVAVVTCLVIGGGAIILCLARQGWHR